MRLMETLNQCINAGHEMTKAIAIAQFNDDSPLRANNLSGNINNIRTLLAHLLCHVKVLSAQHADVLSGVRTSRKQYVGWSGPSKW